MVRNRQIIVYIATSADGFIARTDGSVDWLGRSRPKGNYGMGVFLKSIDTVLWGRKTCDMALDFQKKGVPGTAFDTRVKNYVFTRSLPQAPAPAGVGVGRGTRQGVCKPPAGEKGERHLDDGWRRHHCVVSRRRRDRRVYASRHSQVYRQRHSVDC